MIAARIMEVFPAALTVGRRSHGSPDARTHTRRITESRTRVVDPPSKRTLSQAAAHAIEAKGLRLRMNGEDHDDKRRGCVRMFSRV